MKFCSRKIFVHFLRPFVIQNSRKKVNYASWSCTQSFPNKKPLIDLANSFNHFHTTKITNAKVNFNLSDIGEGIREVVIKEWFVKVGDKVSQFDEICEVQSDKANVTITSRYDGIITKLFHEIDDIALVGQPLLELDTPGELENQSPDVVLDNDDQKDTNTPNIPISAKDEILNDEDAATNQIVPATPAVRRLASENKINLKDVIATGKQGRVLKEDVLSHINKLSESRLQKSVAVKSPTEISDYIEPIRGYRKAMIKTMTESLKIPHFVFSDTFSLTKLIDLKNKIRDKTTESNVKVTYMPFIIKATSNALSRFPVLNSSLDEKCENIIYKNSHNIGFAMDSPDGLVVPVIKNVQNLTVIEIAKEMNRLQQLGKTQNFSLDDISGGTFTISNIGSIGGTYSKPVILPPQVAIFAIGKSAQYETRGEDGRIYLDQQVAWSGAADHRIIDGATLARFFLFWKNQIENPYLLLLNL